MIAPTLGAQSSGTTVASDSTISYGRLPLVFEPSDGLALPQSSFLARARGYQVLLSADEVTLSFPSSPGRLRLRLLKANTAAKAEPLERMPGIVNYFAGGDPSKWRTGVTTFGRVRYSETYPGIDLLYFGNQRDLEYDFVLRPGADPRLIQWEVVGAVSLRIEGGDVIARLTDREVTLRQPRVYQQLAEGRTEIRGRYQLTGTRVSFEIGSYDTSKALVIDPVISYSTFLGGTLSDSAAGIAVSSSGEAYIVGSTSATNFPVTGGAPQSALAGESDVFVAKLNATGTALIYSSYLGGAGTEAGKAIAIDASGNVYIAGTTNSANFPTTTGAFQSVRSGADDGFVAKLSATGGLVYSTYLGGGTGDSVNAIAVDSAGNAFVAGTTASANFPVTGGAFQTVFRASNPTGVAISVFVAKLNPAGSGLIFSTYLGSTSTDPAKIGSQSASGIAIDNNGNAYVVGSTNSIGFPTTSPDFQYPSDTTAPPAAFVTKLSSGGSAVLYSLLLGADARPRAFSFVSSTAAAVAVDSQGNAYVAGSTNAVNFPVTPNAFQPVMKGVCHGTPSGGCLFPSSSDNAFVTKINPAGSALAYSTYLGGSGSFGGGDSARSIAVDGLGNAYVAGGTASLDFPLKQPIQNIYVCGACFSLGIQSEGFVAELNRDGSDLLFSSFLGGDYSDGISGVALDAAGSVYLAGSTAASPTNYAYNNFPVTQGSVQSVPGDPISGFQGPPRADGVVLKLSQQAASVVPTTTYAVMLSGVASVFGSNFGPNAVALLNGRERPTQFVTSTRLDVTLSASDLVTTSSINPFLYLRVYNRLPTGEISGISYPTRLDPGSGATLDIQVSDMAGLPVPGTTVNVYNMTLTLSDTGHLSLPLPTGPYFVHAVTISAPGYQTATIWTRIFPGQITSLGVVLVPNNMGTARTVRVPSTASQNFDTEIDLRSGQSLILYTRGSWDFSASAADKFITGAGRVDCASSGATWTLPNGGRCGALAARIADKPWFATGDAFAGPVATSGRLFLSMNDLAGSFTDNSGTMEVTVLVLDSPVCSATSPSLTMTLAPGFYIAEVRTQPGTREGYWGMEVSTPTGEFSGGINLGGGVQEAANPPGYGAIYITTAQTIHVRASAQVLPGADTRNFSMITRLLDSDRKLVGTEHTGTTLVEFDQAVSPGFYVVEVQTRPIAPRATFQLALTAEALAGGLNVGGFLMSGLVGFGAFYVPETQPVTIRLSGLADFTSIGASCLKLTLLDTNRKVIGLAP